MLCVTDCVLFAGKQLKYCRKGFLPLYTCNSKYVVCFNNFYAGKGFCDIFRIPLWSSRMERQLAIGGEK